MSLMGVDRSGNDNNWTPNNLASTDQMVDTPTNNFCTLNPLMKSYQTPTYYEGNTQTSASSSGWNSIFGSIQISTGKWYWENYYDSSNNYWSGVILMDNQDHDYLDAHSNDGCVIVSGTSKRTDGTNTSWSGFSSGDIIGSALDMDSGTLYTYINGTLEVTQDLTASNKWGKPAVPLNAIYYTYRLHLNFGADSSFAGNKTAQGNQDGNDIGDFYYTPPTGFLALCTSNLPDPAVIPSEHFNTIAYAGNGTDGRELSVGFQPDFVWVKNRSHDDGHVLFDVVRTLSNGNSSLTSNTDAAENTASNTYGRVDSFTTTGYTVEEGSAASGNGLTQVNQSSKTYVAWNWKAGNATLGTGDFTQGSTASTCSRNADAGFSIVSYTGTGSATTVGHGLSKKPEMVIVKNRGFNETWGVYHASNTSAPETDYLGLNSTNATSDYASAWNDTAPTDSLFSLGSWDAVNRSGDAHIAYCFHSVEGYSKVGSYTGNASTDGTFVYTGFRPAYVMIKPSSGTGSWRIWDGTRDDDNPVRGRLSADSSDYEWFNDSLDFTSNGFKFRESNSAWNGSGITYIFLSFSEHPFKYTNAR